MKKEIPQEKNPEEERKDKSEREMNMGVGKKSIAYMLSLCLMISCIVASKPQVNNAVESTTVYFLNSNHWNDIYGYAYANDAGVSDSWPGTKATQATQMGESWYQVVVHRSASAGFSIIFHDGGSNRAEVYINNDMATYVTAEAKVYSSKNAAEYAVGFSNEVEPVKKDYYVDTTGIGAELPYTTYEAENAETNATVLKDSRNYLIDVQSEASGREAVKLQNTGDYVEFELKKPANAMVLRYSMPDSADGKGIDASLSLYVNGNKSKDMTLTSKYAWVYGAYPYDNQVSGGNGHRFFDESRGFFKEGTLAAGTKIRLQKDASCSASYYIIDFIECENVSAKERPENSLSITDYGAVADDGKDDYDAFLSCVRAAKNQRKEVWIPVGTFHLKEKRNMVVSNVTIRGAGMWFSNLIGLGAAFDYSGTCGFYDFSMTGLADHRLDAEDLPAFGGTSASTNSVIENIWMEHVKVGVWTYAAENLTIRGCRIRNTYADGINLCSGSSGARIYNNSVRNTGDDGIAIWPWQGNCYNNKIYNNTVQIPTLANCIAIYGGYENDVSNNYVADTVNNGGGICVSSQFDTSDGFSGTIQVDGNILVRCGTLHSDYKYNIGAIWFWVTNQEMKADYQVTNNTIIDSTYEGILFDCFNELSQVTVSKTKIYGPQTNGIDVRGYGTTALVFDDVGVADYQGTRFNNENSNCSVSYLHQGIYDAIAPEPPTEIVTEATTEEITEPVTEKEEPQISEQIRIEGYQISTTVEGSRVIASVEPEINGKKVAEYGLIYGLAVYNGTVTDWKAQDMTVDSDNYFVKGFDSKGLGVLKEQLGDSATAIYYSMTMKFGAHSKEAYEADYRIRGYAKLSDGTYVYGKIQSYSVFRIANYLYQHQMMPRESAYNYLYDHILSVVDPSYKKIDYGWSSLVQ